MPMYDYGCRSCKHEWEELHPMTEDKKPLGKPCPNCDRVGTVYKMMTKSTPVDPVVINSGKMVDPGLRKTLDKMEGLYPGMKRNM